MSLIQWHLSRGVDRVLNIGSRRLKDLSRDIGRQTRHNLAFTFCRSHHVHGRGSGHHGRRNGLRGLFDIDLVHIAERSRPRQSLDVQKASPLGGQSRFCHHTANDREQIWFDRHNHPKQVLHDARVPVKLVFFHRVQKCSHKRKTVPTAELHQVPNHGQLILLQQERLDDMNVDYIDTKAQQVEEKRVVIDHARTLGQAGFL